MVQDPSRPLKKAEHEAFAVHYAQNGNAAAAWSHATRSRMAKNGRNDEHSNANGSKWTRNRSILARVEWLKTEAARIAREKEDEQTMAAVLTIVEKRKFLARVVRAKLKEEPAESDLWQEVEITGDKVKKKMPDKLRAIALDNDLAGDGSEAKANDALSTAAIETLDRIFGNV